DADRDLRQTRQIAHEMFVRMDGERVERVQAHADAIAQLHVGLRAFELFGPARGKLHVVALPCEAMGDGETDVRCAAQYEDRSLAQSPSLSDCREVNARSSA